jgi:hypothetical protein
MALAVDCEAAWDSDVLVPPSHSRRYRVAGLSRRHRGLRSLPTGTFVDFPTLRSTLEAEAPRADAASLTLCRAFRALGECRTASHPIAVVADATWHALLPLEIHGARSPPSSLRSGVHSRPLRRPDCSDRVLTFGPMTPAIGSRSVLVVLPHPDGLLHRAVLPRLLCVCGLVASRFRSWGPTGFWLPAPAWCVHSGEQTHRAGMQSPSPHRTHPSKNPPLPQPYRVTAARCLLAVTTRRPPDGSVDCGVHRGAHCIRPRAETRGWRGVRRPRRWRSEQVATEAAH